MYVCVLCCICVCYTQIHIALEKKTKILRKNISIWGEYRDFYLYHYLRVVEGSH